MKDYNHEKYDEFINNIIQTRGQFGIPEEEYKERHHIIPKCIGGKGSIKTKNENIIWLYAEEHYEAHKLLALENPDISEFQYAWNIMQHTHEGIVISAEEYAILRKQHAKAVSDKQKNKIVLNKTKEKISKSHANVNGTNNPAYGRHWYNNGKERLYLKDTDIIPEGFVKGNLPLTEEDKQKKSKASRHLTTCKGTHWFNNGIKEIMCKECPDGYKQGRLNYKRNS